MTKRRMRMTKRRNMKRRNMKRRKMTERRKMKCADGEENREANALPNSSFSTKLQLLHFLSAIAILLRF